MILYTPMQLELVTEGMIDDELYLKSQERLINYQGIQLLAKDNGKMEYQITKLLSTDPADFLKPELAPGSIISTSLIN